MELVNLNIKDLTISPLNIRTTEREIKDLARSIKKQGLRKPIKVRKKDNEYEIVDGGRRFLALRELGRTKIPCLVDEIDDVEAISEGLDEAIQRQGIEPMEVANAIKTLLTEYQSDFPDLDSVASHLGLRKATIAEYLELLDLPTQAQRETTTAEKAKDGEGITKTQALKIKEIARNPQEFDEWMDRAKEEGLSVAQLDYKMKQAVKEEYKKGKQIDKPKQKSLDKGRLRPYFHTTSLEEINQIVNDHKLKVVDPPMENQPVRLNLSRLEYKAGQKRRVGEEHGRPVYEVELKKE